MENVRILHNQWEAFRLGDAFVPEGYDNNLRAVKTKHPDFWLELPCAYKLPLGAIYCIDNWELERVIEIVLEQRKYGYVEYSKNHILLGPEGYHFIVHNKHYVTMGWQGNWNRYGLAEAISDIELLTPIKLIKEKWFCLDWERRQKITPVYTSSASGHTCYDIEDIKKRSPACAICQKSMIPRWDPEPLSVETWRIYYNLIKSLSNKTRKERKEQDEFVRNIPCLNKIVCSEKCKNLLTIFINERAQLWLEKLKKERRNQKQTIACRQLLAKTRRAIKETNLDACKSLSKAFKQVVSLHK
jgi:hypothetical protein